MPATGALSVASYGSATPEGEEGPAALETAAVVHRGGVPSFTKMDTIGGGRATSGAVVWR